MLHLHPDKNRLQMNQEASSIVECTVEYEINNRIIYDILNQNCMNTDLYPNVKQPVPKEWQRSILCHSLQIARPKSCKYNSIKS